MTSDKTTSGWPHWRRTRNEPRVPICLFPWSPSETELDLLEDISQRKSYVSRLRATENNINQCFRLRRKHTNASAGEVSVVLATAPKPFFHPRARRGLRTPSTDAKGCLIVFLGLLVVYRVVSYWLVCCFVHPRSLSTAMMMLWRRMARLTEPTKRNGRCS